MHGDTIFALSSGAGRAGLAVVRVSGAAAGAALRRLGATGLPPARRATTARLIDPDSGEDLDQALVLWFPGPASHTGEDVAEFHLHGGPAVVAALLAALGSCDGLRMAEPGEFTRRAFANGKLDLTAAEGVADLIDAETAAQRRQAVRQLRGALGALYEDWRLRLLKLLAHMEASIDFSDEELPADIVENARRAVDGLAAEIGVHLDDGGRGERLRDGVRVAIIGPPNAGKSSLLNLLARRDVAIVAASAGTTRDVIEAHLDLGGYPVTVADTAGLRQTQDLVEIEGVRRALQRAEDADLRLAVLDATVWPEVDGQTADLIDDDSLVVVNKVDLRLPVGPLEVNGQSAMAISVDSGTGIEGLLVALGGRVAALCTPSAGPSLTRARHRDALIDCRECLARAGGVPSSELAAEDMRLAARALGRITGRVEVEDILDVIFADFCIGK